jgi:radical SAM protein with 4Fe4S-binding SPASM domain
MLKSARERGLRITLSTNGTLLRGDNLEAVAECADYVFISLDAASPEIYRAIRGVDYRLAAEGVEALFARRGHAKRPGIYMAYVKLAENEGEIDEFFRKWSGRADGILYYQERLPGGWYDRPNIPEPVVRPPCPHLTGSCAVMVDGKVTPCCFVVSDDDALGTIADGSALEEVYNGLGFTHLRRIHEERRFSESPLCRACNAYAGYGPPEDGGGDFMILRNSFTTFILKKEH